MQERISGNDYFVENILEELDAAGEYFLDGRTLHLIPPAGTALDASTCSASTAPQLPMQNF
jgi:hypothetical protein